MDFDSAEYITIAGKDGIISRVPIKEDPQEHYRPINVPERNDYKIIFHFNGASSIEINILNTSKTFKDIAKEVTNASFQYFNTNHDNVVEVINMDNVTDFIIEKISKGETP